MYNENLKRVFISEVSTSITAADIYLTIFKSINDIEEKYNTDICNMTKEQYEDALRYVGGIRKGYNSVVLHHINTYRNWCKDKGVEVSDVDIRDIKVGEDKIKKHLIVNSIHLSNTLDAMFDSVDKKTNDSVIRAAIWLIYSGVRPKDIGRVRKGDVDLNSMWITFEGKRYPIYRESVECFNFCKTTRSFNYNHPRYKSTTVDRINSDLILSSSKSIMTGVTLKTAVVKRKSKMKSDGSELDTDLNMEHTWLSGVFSRARERELATGIEENFVNIAEQLMKERMGEKEYSLGRNTKTSLTNKKARAIRDSYLSWKELFNI